MTKEECCRIFGNEDIMNLPQVAMDVIMGDKTRRDAIYAELLDVNRHDICMCTPMKRKSATSSTRCSEH